MEVQKAYAATINLTFNYKASETSPIVTNEILPARISYLMIEHLYDNINILPVIFLSLSVSSRMYSQILDTNQLSTFSLKIFKNNKFSRSSISESVLSDTFLYVTSTTTANYTENLDTSGEDTYKNITIGLVSSTMSNQLRQSFNGIEKNSSIKKMIEKGLKGLPNLIMEPIKYDKDFDQMLITPCSSRYAFISQVFKNYPFYDTNFTMYMDFNRTYFLSRAGNAVPFHNNPSSMVINIKGFTEREGLQDGYMIQNNSYIMNVSAANTEVTIDNATEKVANNIVSFSDSNDTQNLTLNINNNIEGVNAERNTYMRTLNAALVKNEMQSNSVIVSLLKQNVDSDIFNPNIAYTINHYKDYSKYDGHYYLYYKREIYVASDGNEFIMSCNVGFKRAGTEELAMSTEDTSKPNLIITSSKTQSSANSKNKTKTTKATRVSKK